MKRVVVIDNSCVGKTTFSSRLALLIGVKHIELDALFWEPNWKEAENNVFRSFTRAHGGHLLWGHSKESLKNSIFYETHLKVTKKMPLTFLA